MQQDYTAYHGYYNTLLFLLPFPVDAQRSSTVAEMTTWFMKMGDMSNSLSTWTTFWTKLKSHSLPMNPSEVLILCKCSARTHLLFRSNESTNIRSSTRIDIHFQTVDPTNNQSRLTLEDKLILAVLAWILLCVTFALWQKCVSKLPAKCITFCL